MLSGNHTITTTHTLYMCTRRCWLGWCDKCGVDKLPTHPLEEDTTAATAHSVKYRYYDEVETPTSFLNPDGTVKMSKHLKLRRISSVARPPHLRVQQIPTT